MDLTGAMADRDWLSRLRDRDLQVEAESRGQFRYFFDRGIWPAGLDARHDRAMAELSRRGLTVGVRND